MSLNMIRAALLARSALPPQYQRVEYLRSSGEQYIETNYTPKINTRFDLDIMYLTFDALTGDGLGSYANNSRLVIGTSSQIGIFYFGIWGANVESSNLTGPLMLNKRYKCYIDLDKRIYGHQELEKSFDYPYRETNGTMALFARKESWNGYGMRGGRIIYGAKLSEGGKAVHNFVPCRRKYDNKPGMWDTVTKTFFTNSGTGRDFILGPDVL